MAGLLGLAPDAAQHTLRTRHRLPTEISWAGADNIAVGAHTVAVRHDRKDGVTLRTVVSHTAYTAPGPTSGPNGGDWGYDHADSRIPAPPLPPSPSPPPGTVAWGVDMPALQLTAQIEGRFSTVTVDGAKIPTITVLQEGDSRLPLTQGENLTQFPPQFSRNPHRNPHRN